MKTVRERVMQKWAVVRIGLVRFAPCHICASGMSGSDMGDRLLIQKGLLLFHAQ